MAWEPIELTEEDVRGFAQKALEFYAALDERGKALAREVIARAGGVDDGPQVEQLDSDARPGNGRAPEQGQLERLTKMLLGVWEPGTTIAPLYSGDMPRTGGGTID